MTTKPTSKIQSCKERLQGELSTESRNPVPRHPRRADRRKPPREFVLSEQPRMQSRVEVVPLRQGDAVVFAVHHRPVNGTRGCLSSQPAPWREPPQVRAPLHGQFYDAK
jgi:oxygenase catalysing oxidative methylation of damaged DNA